MPGIEWFDQALEGPTLAARVLALEQDEEPRSKLAGADLATEVKPQLEEAALGRLEPGLVLGMSEPRQVELFSTRWRTTAAIIRIGRSPLRRPPVGCGHALGLRDPPGCPPCGPRVSLTARAVLLDATDVGDVLSTADWAASAAAGGTEVLSAELTYDVLVRPSKIVCVGL